MAITAFPAALQPVIQQNFLERAFEESLTTVLGFDQISDVEQFAIRAGETITKTRFGKLATPTAPLNAAANTNFDNGVTPNASSAVEQYTMALAEWGDTLDLNVVSDKAGIASRFVQNAANLGEQARRKRDELARDELYSHYLGGNTRVRAALGAPATTVSVDDIRGFRKVFVNGILTPVGAGSTLTVTVGDSAYTLVSAVADGTNVSTAPGGVSGTLTFSANLATANGAVGTPVVSATAPLVIRANGRATTAALVAGDTLSMVDGVMEAASVLRDNAVPDVDGAYNAYLDNRTMKSIFADPAFQMLYRGTGMRSEEYRTGMVVEVGGVRFVPTNMAPQQKLGAVNVKLTLVVGKGALVRGDFAGQDAADAGDGVVMRSSVDGITMLTRPPMDRFGEIVAQSWKWVGGYTVPSDTTANPSIIPTASNSAYKRGVIIESAV